MMKGFLSLFFVMLFFVSRRCTALLSVKPIKEQSRSLLGSVLSTNGWTQTRRWSSASDTPETSKEDVFFSKMSFSDLGIESPVLLRRLSRMGLENPTSIQAGTFSAISSRNDVTVGAETGTGKTLSYLLPLMEDILKKREANQDEDLSLEFDDDSVYDYARAIILVPNKELVQQVVRMALPLAGGPSSLVIGDVPLYGIPYDEESDDEVAYDTQIRLAVMPGALKEPQDFPPFRNSIGFGGNDPPIDLVVTTPAALGPLGLSPKNIDMFADIQTLVVDEADMLLDGGYIRQLENALLGFRRADRLQMASTRTQHVFVAATLPDYGLRSVDAYLQKKFPHAEKVTMAGMHNAKHYGLVDTEWIRMETKKERMQQLVDWLQTDLKGQKVMVFLNSVDDVEGASSALDRAGISAAPYHAKMKLGERTQSMDRFRRYDGEALDTDDDSVSVLVCTDLASRGLDVPGVNVVVQLQFAGNVVAHLHRMGRCGRAGNRQGKGYVFYGETEAALVEVVREAEEQQERMVLPGDVMEIDPEKEDVGKVKQAFSRKRGFTKKRKKMAQEGSS